MEPIKTKISRPPLMVVYGEHKVGKSTFASQANAPIFIQTEDGLEHLGVDAFPLCKDLGSFILALSWVSTEKHEFKTLVIDSLDWLERLIWKDICDKNGWEQLGDGPYGAGYKLALKTWDSILRQIGEINKNRKMFVLFLAHAKIQKFEDPERDNYDRYDLDLHEKSGNLICQAMDIIGFATKKIAVQVKKEGQKTSGKAKMGQESVLMLAKSASYEAGNRYGLTQTPLIWSEFSTALKSCFVSTGNLAGAKEKHLENKEQKNG